jgi:hypothetical protein
VLALDWPLPDFEAIMCKLESRICDSNSANWPDATLQHRLCGLQNSGGGPTRRQASMASPTSTSQMTYSLACSAVANHSDSTVGLRNSDDS